jgi:hypothetical protein
MMQTMRDRVTDYVFKAGGRGWSGDQLDHSGLTGSGRLGFPLGGPGTGPSSANKYAFGPAAGPQES